MGLNAHDLLLLLCSLAFAGLLFASLDWSHRREERRMCRCRHTRKEHNMWLGPCGHRESIGGFWYHCPCEEYRDASKVAS